MVESTPGLLELWVFRESHSEAFLMGGSCKGVFLGGLLKVGDRPTVQCACNPRRKGAQAATRGARASAGWERASETSGRRAGDREAVGAYLSPRLCRLGLHIPSRGDAAVPAQRRRWGNPY